MKSSSNCQSTKSFRYRAIGTLFLVMPLCGLTAQLPTAQAQPVITPPTTINPIGPDQKTAVKNIMATARRERALKTLIDLKVDDATLTDVVSRLQALLPKEINLIDVRTKGSIRVSFDLKQTRVGDILTNVAGLAGSKLYVLSDGIIITDKSALTTSQLTEIKYRRGGEWSQSSEAGGAGWSNMGSGNLMLSLAIAREVIGKGDEPFPTGIVKTTFENFSPASQEMLLELATWLNGRAPSTSTPIRLNASSPVTVDSSQSKSISIAFPPDASHPGERTKIYQHIFVSNPN